MEVVLERLDLGQPLEQPPPCVRVERLAVGPGLDVLAQPDALLVVRDVLDLVGDRAGVGLAQVRERVGEGLAGHGHAQHRRRDAGASARRSGRRLPGSSAGSPTGSDPSGSRRAARWPCMRWAFTSEVAAWTAWSSAASATCAAAGVVAAGTGSAAVAAAGSAAPSARARHAHGLEDPVVEAVLALEQLVDAAQERPRLRALDHAVVVGRGHRHDLLHAELGQPGRVDLVEAGRVADGAGGHDRALARASGAARSPRCRCRPGW